MPIRQTYNTNNLVAIVRRVLNTNLQRSESLLCSLFDLLLDLQVVFIKLVLLDITRII